MKPALPPPVATRIPILYHEIGNDPVPRTAIEVSTINQFRIRLDNERCDMGLQVNHDSSAIGFHVATGGGVRVSR